MDDQEALRRIDLALTDIGFERDWDRIEGRMYRGAVTCCQREIKLSISISDLDFTDLPTITVDNTDDLPVVVTHLFRSDNSVCYLDKNRTVLDRYDPDGTVLRCLKNATATLEAALSGKSNRDFEAEFFAYWSQTFAYIDLPTNYQASSSTLHWISTSKSKQVAYVSAEESVSEPFKRRHEYFAGTARCQTTTCRIVRVPRPLRPDTSLGEWPPTKLATLEGWLNAYNVDLRAELKSAITANDQTRWPIIIRAPNGDFMATVELPNRYRRPEFTQSRRASLCRILFENADAVKIQRDVCRPIDVEHVYGRNTNGIANLMNKKILLVGCGTIGGFLAQQLAQCGAGTGDRGELGFVDSGILEPPNLGRHLLGVPYLMMNKANACQQFLTDSLPHLNVKSYPVHALELKHRFASYDLVVDATGEEALSIAINEIAVRGRPKFPPVLHVWLEGNGAIAQALLTGDVGYACYKCLKPELHGQSRFSGMKTETRFVEPAGCGDLAYVPFPVSRSCQAASLALEMVLSWVNGNLRHRHQARTFDHDKANIIKDGNPLPSDKCPACGKH